MKLTIQVTEEDIREGVRDNCMRCPVSRALERATGMWPEVRHSHLSLFNKETFETIILPMPQSARDFIANFDESRPDHRREPEPFSFEIELPNTPETEK